MAFLILLERLYTLAEPWFTDMVFFATVGDGLLHGRNLYSDLWDNKPPAIYVTYTLAEALLGHSPYLLVGLGFLAAATTLLLIFLAGKALTGRVGGGLLASGFWCLLATDLYLEGSQVSCEAFINLFLVAAFVLLVWPWKNGGPRWWAYSLTGAFWAMASLYKHFMAVEAVGVGLAYLLTTPAGKERKKAILGMILAWGTACALWACVFAYFGFTGRGPIFWETLFTYGRFYSGDLLANFGKALEPQYFLPGWFWFFIPFSLLSLWAVGASYRRHHRLAWVFLAFLALKFFEKAMPGRLGRHHFYQLWVPALCLGAAWGICLVSEKFSRKSAFALGGLLLLALGGYEGRFYFLSPDEWSTRNYGFGYMGVDQAVNKVGQILKPGEQFYEWAEFPRFYYACDRQPPTGLLYGMWLYDSDSLSGGPFAAGFVDRTLRDLERNKPELVIWDKEWKPDGWQEHPVVLYLKSNYHPFAACGLGGRFEFQCRIGGRLEESLKLR